jgi:hypothetical protein
MAQEMPAGLHDPQQHSVTHQAQEVPRTFKLRTLTAKRSRQKFLWNRHEGELAAVSVNISRNLGMLKLLSTWMILTSAM